MCGVTVFIQSYYENRNTTKNRETQTQQANQRGQTETLLVCVLISLHPSSRIQSFINAENPLTYSKQAYGRTKDLEGSTKQRAPKIPSQNKPHDKKTIHYKKLITLKCRKYNLTFDYLDGLTVSAKTVKMVSFLLTTFRSHTKRVSFSPNLMNWLREKISENTKASPFGCKSTELCLHTCCNCICFFCI